MQIRRAEEHDTPFVLEYLTVVSAGVHIIEDDSGEKLGLVEYRDYGDYNLHIDFIEVIAERRGQHIATDVISYLQEMYPEHDISGESLPRDQAYYFWESLGSEFYMEFDYDDYVDMNTCIPFVIHQGRYDKKY